MRKQGAISTPKSSFPPSVTADKWCPFGRNGLSSLRVMTTDAAFVIQKGMVKLSAKSKAGKEATLGILSDKDFVGEDCLAGQPLRIASASAMTDCDLLRIEKEANDVLTSWGTDLVRSGRCIFIGAEHPISRGFA
jgi:Cyclic nucleotide-binding domain